MQSAIWADLLGRARRVVNRTVDSRHDQPWLPVCSGRSRWVPDVALGEAQLPACTSGKRHRRAHTGAGTLTVAVPSGTGGTPVAVTVGGGGTGIRRASIRRHLIDMVGLAAGDTVSARCADRADQGAAMRQPSGRQRRCTAVGYGSCVWARQSWEKIYDRAVSADGVEAGDSQRDTASAQIRSASLACGVVVVAKYLVLFSLTCESAKRFIAKPSDRAAVIREMAKLRNG
jgi:hypothetical protein